MPKIIIKEHNNTKSGLSEYGNFTVLVPGLAVGGKSTGLTDNIFITHDLAKFKKEIGEVGGTAATGYGNEIARRLIGLGYEVMYLVANKNDLVTGTCLDVLKDKSSYDFRYAITGFTEDTIPVEGDSDLVTISENIISLCDFKNSSPATNGRGDVIALIDLNDKIYTGVTTQAAAITAIKAEAGKLTASSYAAFFTPAVVYRDVTHSWPASVHYLACAIEAFSNVPEWFAVAGYTRGKCSTNVVKTTFTLGDAAVQALEPRAAVAAAKSAGELNTSVNPIIKNKDAYYIWGNRTARTLEANGDLVAGHFLNIRQLCTTLKKQLYTVCRRFTFEPNSDVLWVNFVNAIEPTLERMKSNQGIEDYQIIKKKVSKKAVLNAIIRIVPIEAVEDFEIDLTLEDSINGVNVVVEDK